MPKYKNVAARIVGVSIGRGESAQVVLVNPKETVECSEEEAAHRVSRGELQRVDSAAPSAAPARKPELEKKPEPKLEPELAPSHSSHSSRKGG